MIQHEPRRQKQVLWPVDAPLEQPGLKGPQELSIRRILVPTDFSPCSIKALNYAMLLARQFEATIILLHVVEPAAGVDGVRFSDPAVEESSRHMLEHGRESLAAICRDRLGNGVPIETLVRMGRAYSEIPDTAKALACDLIVLGTHGAVQRGLAMGSTADKVVHQSFCPVLTLRPC